ncbi:uncharacterized protein LOC111054192 [Nilaparvata lugens]|uniref:uncharacterized protein LOC111054192 n=1 Tax=Nilaparvata lugens TaxID=108931 RepID=UPI00193D29C5|nr:uncharacterized protein LOC111054192 [Nilaparvata lugens]
MNFQLNSFYKGDSCCRRAKTGFISGLKLPLKACIVNIRHFIAIVFSTIFYHVIPNFIMIASVWLMFAYKTIHFIHKQAKGEDKLLLVLKILMAISIVQVCLFLWLKSQEILDCILSIITSVTIFFTDNGQAGHKFFLNSLFFKRRSNESRPITELLCFIIAICTTSYILYSTVNKLRSSNTVEKKTCTRIEPDNGIFIILVKDNCQQFTSTSSKSNKYLKNLQDYGNENSSENSRMLTRARTRYNARLPDVIKASNN